MSAGEPGAAPVPAGGRGADGAPDRAALQRRTLRVLVAAQMLGGAGIAAGVTVGALIAEDLLGATGWSGLPATLFTAGSASAALLAGRVSQRRGRRVGLVGGYAAGALGAAGVVLAAVIESVPLLFAALLVYGAGTAANLQGRYAGADLAGPAERARAVSVVLVATTAGAVAGPSLVDVMGGVAEAVDVPRLAGPFLLATVAFALAALVLQLLLRPDPLLAARQLDRDARPAAEPGDAPAAPVAARGADVTLAATAMVLAQVVMVAVMTMTPVHMRDHGHDLGATGLVIGVHIACMYLPSPLSGAAADRWGRRPVIAAGGVVLLLAGVVAAAAPADAMAALTLALGLLGLGWNLALVGGSALLTDATPLATRARTQGAVDLGVAVAGATAGLVGGLVVAATSYAALCLGSAAIALALLPALVGIGRRGSTPALERAS